jgi:hypothetical protein
MFLRRHIYTCRVTIALIVMVGLGGCNLQDLQSLQAMSAQQRVVRIGPTQVGVSVYAPWWKAYDLEEDKYCKHEAYGYARLYVECMEARGYIVSIFEQGGVRITASQLPSPPPPQPTSYVEPTEPPSVKSAEPTSLVELPSPCDKPDTTNPQCVGTKRNQQQRQQRQQRQERAALVSSDTSAAPLISVWESVVHAVLTPR